MMALDGELSPDQVRRVNAHLSECSACRARNLVLQDASAAIANLARPELPPSYHSRAVLQTELSKASTRNDFPWQGWLPSAGICALLLMGVLIGGLWNRSTRVVTVPDPKLTPGATVVLSPGEVCNASRVNNKAVPVALRKKVFEAYGIPHAEPRAYEVDYLITPALGGADDIHNLWPQSYSDTIWNAQVKDDLEDHLRALVCEGKLDLATAQHELAVNWIDAYKKYFHTDRPR